MTERNTQYAKKIGLPPGSLVYVGTKRTEKVSIAKIDISKGLSEEIELSNISGSIKNRKDNAPNWINIHGVHDAAVIKSVGRQFNIDSLVLEAIMNTEQRPGAEVLDNYLFIRLKALKLTNSDKNVATEQLSLILGQNYLLSFEESGSDIISIIEKRLYHEKENIQTKREDYFFYRILDTIVDNYYLIADTIGEHIEQTEEDLIKKPDDNTYKEIYRLKKEMAIINKAIVPLKDAASTIKKSDIDCISEANKKYFNNVYEHLVQIVEEIEFQYNKLNDFVNMYMSGLSNKMNEIMQVLTIFASIFIPLTFIAGVYGMNFDFMPELHLKYGYYITWGAMVAVVIVLLFYFKKKKWL